MMLASAAFAMQLHGYSSEFLSADECAWLDEESDKAKKVKRRGQARFVPLR
jgi:hypothetical protein